MKRISKRVREGAVMLCALAASNRQSLAQSHMDYFACAGHWSLEASEAWGLANRTRLYASEAMGGFGSDPGPDHYYLSCAEAEALLRDGWTP